MKQFIITLPLLLMYNFGSIIQNTPSNTIKPEAIENSGYLFNDDFDIVYIKNDYSNYIEEDLDLTVKSKYASKRWYYKKNGKIYKICRDQDGPVLVTPNGQRISYGRGYKISDIKSRYGLGKYYTRSVSNSSCRNFN